MDVKAEVLTGSGYMLLLASDEVDNVVMAMMAVRENGKTGNHFFQSSVNPFDCTSVVDSVALLGRGTGTT